MRRRLLLLLTVCSPLCASEIVTSPRSPAHYEPLLETRTDECPAMSGSTAQIQAAIDCRSAAIHGAHLDERAKQAARALAADAGSLTLFPFANLPGWACAPAPQFNAYFAYFNGPQNQNQLQDLAALQNNGGALNEITAFAAQFDTNGNLILGSGSASDAKFLTGFEAQAKALYPDKRLLLTVVNDRGGIATDPQVVHDKIAPENVDQHVQDLLALAQNVDGLNIDYENLFPGDGPSFTVFIQKLAQKLHEQGKYLAVNLEPKFSDTQTSRPIDWAAVGAAADRVRIMAYNFAGKTPGSNAPPDEIQRLIDYAKSKGIDSDKTEIVLPIHGFDWPEGGASSEIDNLSAILKLASDNGATIGRDPATLSPHYSYTKDGVTHQVWFEDAFSIFQKEQLVRANGIANVGLWQMGSGDLQLLFQLNQLEQLLRTFARQLFPFGGSPVGYCR